MNGQRGATGMPSPPTSFTLPPPPPSPVLISADAADFVPMSNILNQTRNVLYDNNQQNLNNSLARYKYVSVSDKLLPTENVNNITTQSSGQTPQHGCTATNTTMTGHHSAIIPSYTGAGSMPGSMSGVQGVQYVTQPAPVLNSDPAPPWALHMMNRLSQIESHMSSQTMNWRNLDTTLQNQNSRMTNIERQIKDLNQVKHEVNKSTISVSAMQDDISSMNRKINEYDYSINTYSEMCDEAASNQKLAQTTIEDLCERVGNLEKNQSTLQPKLQKFESEITDLQCRSMRDNLVFTGIEEPEYIEGNTPENAESTLKDFLKHEMKIDEPIQFHRVHRLNYSENQERYNNVNNPRHIVAKFERFKDREYVRHQASKTLRGKPFGVREQFPRVIEEKRRLLYPEMKRARANPENKVRLVKDKLYINNAQFIPSHDNTDERDSFVPNRPRDNTYRRQNGSQNSFNTRTFQNSNYKSYGQSGRGARPKYGQRGSYDNNSNRGRWRESDMLKRTIDFSIEQLNRFSSLYADGYESDRSTSRKHKASSPADGDKSSKKQQIDLDDRDQGNPANEQNGMETESYQQCDPPLGSNDERTMPVSPQTSVELVRTPEAMPLLNDPHITADNHNDVTASEQSTEA